MLLFLKFPNFLDNVSRKLGVCMEFFLRPGVRMYFILGEVTLSEGMGPEEAHVVCIGFLNDHSEHLPQYQEVYDVEYRR